MNNENSEPTIPKQYLWLVNDWAMGDAIDLVRISVYRWGLAVTIFGVGFQVGL